MTRSAPLALALALALWTVGCGPSGRGAREPAPPSLARPDCGATCEDVDLRGPIAAAALGDDRVAVAARQTDRRIVLGVATLRGGAWDPTSLRLRPMDERPAHTVALASGGDDPAWMVVARDEGVSLYRLADDGEVELEAELPTVTASSAALAAAEDTALLALRAPDGVASLFLVRDGEAAPLALAPEHPVADVAVAFVGGEPVAGFASDAGVELRRPEGAVAVSEEPAREVALAGSRSRGGTSAPIIAWSNDDGVWAARIGPDPDRPAPVLVDDGARPEEPAHRVGAALALLAGGDRLLAAYQDQTDGRLVLALEGPSGYTRRELASPEHTRAMHLALARAGELSVALDLAGQGSGRGVRMRPLVTTLER